MTTLDSSSIGAPLLVWDCGSALYDSYEFTAFKRQLDAAVLAGGRSLSMPHLSSGSTPPPPPPADDVVRHQQRPGRRSLSTLLRRLFSKVIRLRLFPASARNRGARHWTTGDCSCGAGSPWSGSGALTSIPEEEQSGSGSGSSSPDPEKRSSPVEPGPSALRKSQSERFIGSKAASSSMVQFEVVV
ncbi:hypothetical protein PR202_gb22991 [Eleusine coracana subsp. coracana]|uniref:Uncharacterized protein n=1 Tax=Eleusine coracana subsp. coracana TaxID=191504 RepID=A0AAV5FH83_ELECO|nr:hypothetical protein PR202_gb22991 [Eleusine coracana subsp. coracana]